MRELKFRGLRVKTREWVHGYLVERGKTIHGGKEVYEDDIVVPAGYSSSIQYSIIGGTGGQYTGLKDNNGKEIYGGDIVKQNYLWETNDPQTLGAMEVDREIIGVVGIDEYGSYTKTEDGIYYWLEYLELSDQLEVIGNIHEDPELLKEVD